MWKLFLFMFVGCAFAQYNNNYGYGNSPSTYASGGYQGQNQNSQYNPLCAPTYQQQGYGAGQSPFGTQSAYGQNTYGTQSGQYGQSAYAQPGQSQYGTGQGQLYDSSAYTYGNTNSRYGRSIRFAPPSAVSFAQ